MTSVMSSDTTSRAAEIMGGGGSGGGRLGALGMQRPERAQKRDSFIVMKECQWMPPVNVEGKVAAHALRAVCKRRTEEFLGWALTVPRGGSSLWGNPARMSAMEVIVVGRRCAAVVNAGT